jgi:CBS domain containing-hemolysin-like protein
MSVFEQSGHSRMPVYAETLDDPRGMIHIRDVMGHITRLARVKKGRVSKAAAARPPALDLANVDLTRSIGELNLIRSVLFVPPSMLASDLMARMQAARTQMALVIDEYGGTDGLVSLEDIVEMVVGDIEDEHDDDEPLITQAGEGVFIVDAKAEIDDVAAKIGEDFKPGEHGEYVDTIGGMIFNTLGRVPARGEVVQAIPGFEFHVLDADPRRVKRVRIVHDPKGERRRRVREQQA